MTIANNILLVNDDGINATGLKSLANVAKKLAKNVWVVAPAQEQSAVSRAITYHQPVFIDEVGDKQYAVKGTPADCVIMALEVIMPEPPDLILSGINKGHNAADFVHFSGTFAGAGTGAMFNIPSMALSLMGDTRLNDSALNWQMVEHFAPKLITQFYELKLKSQDVLNVNFPDCPKDAVKGVKICHQMKRTDKFLKVEKRKSPRGGNYYWTNLKGYNEKPEIGSELDALQNNYISITAINQNLTNFEVNEELKRIVKTMI